MHVFVVNDVNPSLYFVFERAFLVYIYINQRGLILLIFDDTVYFHSSRFYLLSYYEQLSVQCLPSQFILLSIRTTQSYRQYIEKWLPRWNMFGT